ncbi:NOT2/NOT3/NOT5 [Lasallia pustulata]|uniref:General negative regulator of transcription subunit n=1 Tax=Lasallia pustulata TaxID=136370 RepID=A0A1W5D2H7_9LECA|nr:NOT2/NOT3/NOT5 [Lasallia pustulata]
MAQRKLQQEIDKTFKKVSEGIQAFEGIFDKINQTTNASQKEKLEDALKREIKKLQRHRDQIKTWAAGNEIKDKKPLMEQRKAIENQMEKFKAVEKEMKTKAFSKEGLSAAAKLDPKEKEKLEACQFLSNMVEELERQIETFEAEEETLQVTVKKGKKDTSRADRLGEIARLTERHKWHQGKLELLLRSLENGNVDTDQVHGLEESIKYYVEENQTVEFMEDDTIYDDLNLEEDEGVFGMNNDNDRVSSQDTQSVQDDLPETADGRGNTIGNGKPKSSSISEPPTAAARRPSNQLKSPLPALATLHTPLANNSNGTTNNTMKPAPLPTRAPGETLKYASAAAAAAPSDKNALGIAPLPPPPGAAASASNASAALAPLPSAPIPRSSATTSPSAVPSLPTSVGHTPAQKAAVPVTASTDGASSNHAQPKSPTLSQSSAPTGASVPSSVPSTPALDKTEVVSHTVPKMPPQAQALAREEKQQLPLAPELPQAPSPLAVQPTVGLTNGDSQPEPEDDESIYHLPPGLQDLIQSFEVTKSRAPAASSPSVQRLLGASHATWCAPSRDYIHAERPRHYRPQTKYNTPRYYPQEPFTVIDDPNLYGRIDTDTLFYIFYYRQGTYQQYLAAKSLKNQSWRFHKQYQTWFQRHEEPKTITEEYEQGTYRFFDYESTWMNRRKADFKFAYKFLEDDL